MTDDARPDETRKSPALLLAVAWTFVGIPLAWGIYQTFIKSLALFR